MNEIRLKFKDREINRKGTLLYSKATSLCFIQECARQGITILGIDGFFLTEHTIQPSMDNSIDFTSILFSGDIFNAAISFLEDRPDTLFFEIVYEE